MSDVVKLGSVPKLSFISLGCPKNLVDSEVLLGRLVQNGFYLCEDYEDSDVIVINTCGFLQEAKQESLDVIQKAINLRDQGIVKGVVVAGCLPQRDPEEAARLLPQVDAIVGSFSRDHIVEICKDILDRNGEPRQTEIRITRDIPKYEVDRDRLRLTPPYTAYIRLSEGCNHTCAFCVIPKIKGRFRSKPMEVLVEEARELAGNGAREINLIAQDTTSYGLDLYRKLALPELLESLAQVDGIEWIRLLYCYPTFVNPRLAHAMAQIPQVARYIDLPIQHTRDKMLRLMRRGMTETRQKELIAMLRQEIPGLVIRTTVIVGFPGEKEEDFEGLCEDLEQLRFERLGSFQYSREPNTSAYDMPNPVDDAAKERRWDRVMQIQQRIAREVNRSFVGRSIPVIAEKRLGLNRWQGRTYGDAPTVDGQILLTGEAQEGKILTARVTGVRGYDLTGALEKPPHAQ